MSRHLNCSWAAALPLALAALLGLSACTDRHSSKGWASQVPPDATRFVAQTEDESPAATTCAPAEQTASTPTETPAEKVEIRTPSADEWASKITEETVVTLWYSYRGAERDAIKKIADDYHALGTKVSIKLRYVPFDAFNDKIKIVIPRDRGPDLFIFAHDLVGAWSEMGFLEPLSQWTTAEDMKKFMPSTVQSLVYRRTLYGLPMAFKSLALYYNQKLVPKPPETFEELLKAAEANSGDGHFGLVYEATNLYFHAPFVYGLGGTTLDENDRVHIATQPARRALELAYDLVRTRKVTPRSVNTAMVSSYFNEGKAAMAINGPWMRGEIDPSIPYGVAPLPKLESGKPARPFLTVEAVYLNKFSKKKDAAIEVMRWLVSDHSALVRFKTGKQPVANPTVWEQAGVDIDPRMRAFLTQSEASVLMPSSPRMQQVWTPYNDALLSVISGDDKPADALARAQKKVESDMKRAGGGQ